MFRRNSPPLTTVSTTPKADTLSFSEHIKTNRSRQSSPPRRFSTPNSNIKRSNSRKESFPMPHSSLAVTASYDSLSLNSSQSTSTKHLRDSRHGRLSPTKSSHAKHLDGESSEDILDLYQSSSSSSSTPQDANPAQFTQKEDILKYQEHEDLNDLPVSLSVDVYFCDSLLSIHVE